MIDPQKPAKYLLIGTTDDKTWTSEFPTRKEVDYLLKSANRAIPGLNIGEKDIFTAYSGFRPLPASNKNAGAVTRRHIIRRVGDSRIFHIIGGKITTFRSLSEQVGDQVVNALKKEPGWEFTSRMKDRGRCTTATQPLPGGHGIQDIEAYKQTHVPQAAQEYDITPNVVAELIDRYGSRYREVLDLTRPDPADSSKGPHLKAPLTKEAPLILAQVLHAIRYEQAETLMDIMTESLKMDLLPGSGLDAAEAAVNLLAHEKPPFTEDEKARELATYRNYVAGNQQWRQQ